MKSLTKNHWLIISATVLLTLFVFLAPRKFTYNSQSVDSPDFSSNPEFNLDKIYSLFRDSVFKNINPDVVKQYQTLEKINQSWKNDSLFSFFKQLRQPFLAAYWAGKIAENSPNFDNYSRAGKFFLIGFEFAPTPMVKQICINEAINFYSKALKENPNSIETQINLADCYVEGGADPMKGIGILREVLQKDSNNVAAQFKMGIFAVRSQQFEKAVARFKKVLVLEPTNTEALLYLGECYATLGNKNEALKAFEQFKSLSNDTIINAEVDEFIEKLKKS